ILTLPASPFILHLHGPPSSGRVCIGGRARKRDGLNAYVRSSQNAAWDMAVTRLWAAPAGDCGSTLRYRRADGGPPLRVSRPVAENGSPKTVRQGLSREADF